MGNLVEDRKNRLWEKGIVPYEFGDGFASTLPSLSSWVGRRGNTQQAGNNAADVRTVQALLNKVPPADGGPMPQLTVDGAAGESTIKAIQSFQLKRFGWKGADGRVDPKGATLAALSDAGQGNADVDKQSVLEAIAYWNDSLGGHMNWMVRGAQTDFVVFVKSDGRNRSNGIGRQGRSQSIELNFDKARGLVGHFGGSVRGVIVHEMGHAGGLIHEHQRSDRDKYVEFPKTDGKPNWRSRCPYLIGVNDPPAAGPQDMCTSPFVRGTPHAYYDYESTMHYFGRQQSRNGQPVMVRKPGGSTQMGSFQKFSAGDLATLQNMYPFRGYL